MSKNTPYSAGLIASKYWQNTPLHEMSDQQWEGICDGCARCCLHKFIDDDTVAETEIQHSAPGEKADETMAGIDSTDSANGSEPQLFVPTDYIKDKEEIHYTNIVCYLLNDKTCACTQYQKRTELVPDCVSLTKDNLKDIFFMPPSCSYRRLYEGKGLAHWHPLLNKGKKSKMHQLGISVRNKVVNEANVDINNFEDYIVTWPLQSLDEHD